MPGEASRGGSFDSFCAFGGIETLLPYLFSGHLLKSTNLLNFSVLFATLGLAFATGRAFCGWLCGLGAIQDFVAGWTQKLLGEKHHIRGKPGKTTLPLRLPPGVDRPFRYVKYLILTVILIASLATVFPPLHPFCPIRAVFSFKLTRSCGSHLVFFWPARFWLNASGASTSVRWGQRLPSSTGSRLYASFRMVSNAIIADAVILSVRWASQMCRTI